MKKKMIIFFLANFGQGGAGQSISRLCLNLSKKNYKILILCLNKCFYKKIFSENKIEVIEINKKKVLFAIGIINKIVKTFIKKHNKVIFVSNLFYSNAITLLFLKRHKKLKLVLTERTPLQELNIYFGIIDFIKKIIIKIILKINYKKADLIISNSKKTASDISKFSNGNSIYIYPPSYKKFVSVKKKDQDILRILSVGRLSAEKNFKNLIENLSRLKNVNFTLKIIGDGPERKKLSQLIRKKNFEKKIKIISYRKNIRKYFMESDLFVSSSKFEGFPNVVVEAISNNLPVLSSSSHGGIYEILKNKKYGMIYNSENLFSFESKIKYFIKNKEKFTFSKANVKKDFREFHQKISSQKYDKVFKKL